MLAQRPIASVLQTLKRPTANAVDSMSFDRGWNLCAGVWIARVKVDCENVFSAWVLLYRHSTDPRQSQEAPGMPALHLAHLLFSSHAT